MLPRNHINIFVPYVFCIVLFSFFLLLLCYCSNVAFVCPKDTPYFLHNVSYAIQGAFLLCLDSIVCHPFLLYIY